MQKYMRLYAILSGHNLRFSDKASSALENDIIAMSQKGIKMLMQNKIINTVFAVSKYYATYTLFLFHIASN